MVRNMSVRFLLIVLPILLIAGCKDGAWLSLSPEEIFSNPSTVALVRDACSGALHKSPLEQSRRDLLEDHGVHGLTPLFSVMALNCAAGFEDLLKLGANPNHGFENGVTVLHFASWGMSLNYVAILLKYNANPNLIGNVRQQARAMSHPARNLNSEPTRSADHGVQLHPVPARHVAA
jgi:hypothetical protein